MAPSDEFLTIVKEDLQYLLSEWNESVEDAALRRGSTVLRRLLVHGDLNRAWRRVGFPEEPQVACSTLRPLLKRFPAKGLAFATAGGARYQGTEISNVTEWRHVLSPEQIQEQYLMFKNGMAVETVGLHTFVESPAIVVAGELVLRRVLVKYVSDKLGGAHHDPKRGTNHEEQLFRLLDKSRAEMQILGKPTVFFELLAIGQTLARAQDIKRFCEAAK